MVVLAYCPGYRQEWHKALLTGEDAWQERGASRNNGRVLKKSNATVWTEVSNFVTLEVSVYSTSPQQPQSRHFFFFFFLKMSDLASALHCEKGPDIELPSEIYPDYKRDLNFAGSLRLVCVGLSLCSGGLTLLKYAGIGRTFGVGISTADTSPLSPLSFPCPGEEVLEGRVVG